MHIAAVICQNGLGHFRRTVGVLSRLVRFLPEARVTVFCEQWQLTRMASWARARDLFAAGAVAVTGVLGRAVHLAHQSIEYRDGRLQDWEARLAQHPVLRDASLVLSDNLVGTLSVRSDTVLLGSFLWSDVLPVYHPDEPAVAAFVTHERALLARHRPPMICVADLVMPAVQRSTRAVEVGWMCESETPRQPMRKMQSTGRSVAFLAGASGRGERVLVEAAERLLAEGQPVSLPEDLLATLPAAVAARCKRFEHTERAFRALSLAVCRPGVGTLTDCLAHRVPVLAVPDARNPEMLHNAACIESLGFGRALPPGRDASHLVDEVRAMLSPATRQACTSAMTNAKADGLDATARLLSNWAVHGVPAKLTSSVI